MPTDEELDALRRDSKLRLDREGRWWHDGEPVRNEKIAALFDRGIRVDDAGEVRLYVGDQWAYVEVEDTAYVVRRARDLDDGGLRLILNDGTEEDLDPATLTLRGEHDLYCRVGGARHRARFLRDAYHHVIHRFEEAEAPSSRYVVRVGGDLWPVAEEGDALREPEDRADG